MNFSYGVIAAVGVLVAISLGLIAISPDDIIQPRMISDEKETVACTLQWDPMCGVDGKTYGNLCMLDAANVKLDHKGECVDMSSMSEALPMSLTISIPKGSGVSGCENTKECFLPYEVSVAVGATVIWNNDDTAAHTVTSGSISSADGLFDSGIFDSGIFAPDTSFKFTFDNVGTYDYFCLIHPWMTGIVNVI